MRYRYCAAASAAIVLVTAVAAGAADELVGAVKAREGERHRAMVAVDLEALDDLFAPDAIYVHSNALAQSKAELIAMLTKGDIRYVAFDAKEASYREYGATVIVTGVQSIALTSAGKPFTSKSRYTIVYATIDGEPKVVAYQSTSLPEIVKQEKPRGE